MTQDEQELVLKLVGKGIPKDEFLAKFRNSGDGVALTARLLKQALESRDGVDVEMALMVGFVFGFTKEHLPLLVELETSNWHERHEDVVSALGDLLDVDSLKSLYHATQWIPEYLHFDESRALAVKAIWAIGRINAPEADAVLISLMNDPEPILAGAAAEQMKRRTVT